LRTFVIGSSDFPSHAVLARRLRAYLRWRNANARHPDVLAAQRRERARIRSERQQRWGGDGPNPKPRDQPQQKVHGQRASQRRNRFPERPAIMSAGDPSILVGDDAEVCAYITLLPR
jgi:hypothetical protein